MNMVFAQRGRLQCADHGQSSSSNRDVYRNHCATTFANLSSTPLIFTLFVYVSVLPGSPAVMFDTSFTWVTYEIFTSPSPTSKLTLICTLASSPLPSLFSPLTLPQPKFSLKFSLEHSLETPKQPVTLYQQLLVRRRFLMSLQLLPTGHTTSSWPFVVPHTPNLPVPWPLRSSKPSVNDTNSTPQLRQQPSPITSWWSVLPQRQPNSLLLHPVWLSPTKMVNFPFLSALFQSTQWQLHLRQPTQWQLRFKQPWAPHLPLIQTPDQHRRQQSSVPSHLFWCLY